MALNIDSMLVFDTETTGTNVESDRIVTITVAVWNQSGTGHLRHALLNPGVEIPAGATAVHGIPTEQARSEGQSPAAVLPDFAAELRQAWQHDDPVVAFNAPFDLTILDRELRRYGHPGFAPDECIPVIDPLVLDKWADPYRKGSRQLADVCAYYRVTHGGAHDATEDAAAAGRLARAMCHRFAGLRSMSLREVHTAQVGWKAAQARSLRQYWARKGDPRAAEVDGAWPIRPIAAAPTTLPERRHLSECPAVGDPPEIGCTCDDFSPEWTI